MAGSQSSEGPMINEGSTSAHPIELLVDGQAPPQFRVHGQRCPLVPGAPIFSVPRELLYGFHFSDFPERLFIRPDPGECKADYRHTIISLFRSGGGNFFAGAALLYMLRIVDWQEIELSKIFGALSQAVVERREQKGDVFEAGTSDFDLSTGKPVESLEFTKFGAQRTRLSYQEKEGRTHEHRTFAYRILFRADCAIDEALNTIERTVTQLEANKEQILRRHLDPLTNVLNRGMYEQDFPEFLNVTTSARGQASLIVLDVDHFHDLNNRYGHATGDAVLREIASAIGRVASEVGKVYRYGGEEFAVLLPQSSSAQALDVAEKIRQAVELVSCRGAHPTISCGIAAFPNHAGEPRALFRAADAALGRAKRSGRNQSCVASAPRRRTPRPARTGRK